MKNAIVVLLLITAAETASAQSDAVWAALDFFYTSANTEVRPAAVAPGSDRLNGVGLAVAVEGDRFIGDFRYEHNFASLPDLLSRYFDLDAQDLARDRYELAGGYEVYPGVDLHTGIRNERITFDPGIRRDAEYVALLGGVGFHSPRDRLIGVEGHVRRYFGGTGLSRGRTTDTRGYAIELRLPVTLPSWNIRIVPAVALDRIRMDTEQLDLRARRYAVGFSFAAANP